MVSGGAWHAAASNLQVAFLVWPCICAGLPGALPACKRGQPPPAPVPGPAAVEAALQQVPGVSAEQAADLATQLATVPSALSKAPEGLQSAVDFLTTSINAVGAARACSLHCMHLAACTACKSCDMRSRVGPHRQLRPRRLP